MHKSKAHHSEKGFRNPHLHEHHGFVDFLKWRWHSRNIKPKKLLFPITQENHEQIHQNPGSSNLTWIGHSTFLAQLDGLNILTDPHFSDRASPVSFAGPKRLTPPGLALDQLPEIDCVLISHNHYDHLDLQSVRQISFRQESHPPKFFVPLGLKKWFAKHSIANVTELDWWQNFEYQGWQIHSVPAQHFSGRTLFDRNQTLWCGWLLENGQYKFYFAGDSGYFSGFREIGQQFGPIDLSLIPIGAYEPRWFMRPVHVNPEEAVQIHLDVRSEFSVGMHWGAFCLTDEDMDEPPRLLKQACTNMGISSKQFTVMQHGQTMAIKRRVMQ